MRRFHGDARRPDRAFVLALCRPSRRLRSHHHRRRRHGRSAPSFAAGISATPCVAMRLLHTGDDLGGPRAAARQCRSERRRNTRRPQRQSLHVHGLRQYRARGARRCEQREGEMSAPQKWVGQALERTEDRRLITRGGHFIDDLTLPGVAHAAYVRSPHARAKIRHIDVRRAFDHPGVYAVITGEEVAQLTRPQRGRVSLANSPKVYALAYQQVRYVGEPVVGIAAVDRATAEDAADLIEVEYDPLPPVLDPEQALRPDAPLVFEEVGSNILWHDTFPYGDVKGAFKEADTVVDERVTIHRYCSTPLETFGVMAQYEAATQSYTIWGHTQQPAQDLHMLTAALGISPSKIRMIVPPMDGSFGNKMQPLFIIAAALLARKAGRPVKWIEDRRENLLALGHAADGIMDMRAAGKADGTVLAIKFRNIENEGAGIDFAARHNLLMLSNIANCYRFRALSYEGYSVVTNRCPVVANRGIGKPFMCFSVERMIDTVARELEIDRAEIRFRNFIQPNEFPYDTPSGQTYDSGDYPEMLRRALAAIDYEKLRHEQAEGRERGRLLGIGIATAVEPGGSNLSYGMLVSDPSQLTSMP